MSFFLDLLSWSVLETTVCWYDISFELFCKLFGWLFAFNSFGMCIFDNGWFWTFYAFWLIFVFSRAFRLLELFVQSLTHIMILRCVFFVILVHTHSFSELFVGIRLLTVTFLIFARLADWLYRVGSFFSCRKTGLLIERLHLWGQSIVRDNYL